MYGIETKTVLLSGTSYRVSLSFSSHVFSMNFTRYPLAFRSLITRWCSLCRCSVLYGLHLARSMSVLTTALLLFAGLSQNVKTAFRPVKTLGDVFKKPILDRLLENQVSGIVYKVKCKSCPFVYIGKSKTS